MSKPTKPSAVSTASPKPTKMAQLHALVSRRKGVGMGELQTRLGWQPHTVRAAISRLRKGGMTITCAKSDAGPIYRLQSTGAEQAQ